MKLSEVKEIVESDVNDVNDYLKKKYVLLKVLKIGGRDNGESILYVLGK